MSLQAFKDGLAKTMFGMTVAEAHEKGVCISCKESMADLGMPTDKDREEYRISGLCYKCFPEEI